MTGAATDQDRAPAKPGQIGHDPSSHLRENSGRITEVDHSGDLDDPAGAADCLHPWPRQPVHDSRELLPGFFPNLALTRSRATDGRRDVEAPTVYAVAEPPVWGDGNKPALAVTAHGLAIARPRGNRWLRKAER